MIMRIGIIGIPSNGFLENVGIIKISFLFETELHAFRKNEIEIQKYANNIKAQPNQLKHAY